MALLGSSKDILLPSQNFLGSAAQQSLSSRPARAGRRAANDCIENPSWLSSAPIHACDETEPDDSSSINSHRVAPCTRTEATEDVAGTLVQDKSSCQGYSYEPTSFGRRKRGAGGGFLILPTATNSDSNSHAAADARKSAESSNVSALKQAAGVLGHITAPACGGNHSMVIRDGTQQKQQEPGEAGKVTAAGEHQQHDQDATGAEQRALAGFRFKFGARLVRWEDPRRSWVGAYVQSTGAWMRSVTDACVLCVHESHAQAPRKHVWPSSSQTHTLAHKRT
jgi:hypothetical protein